MKTTIYLMRHAQTIPKDEGSPETWGLSETGVTQAQNLAADLGAYNIDVVVSSPYKRAVDTVRPFCLKNDKMVIEDDDLRDQLISKNYMAPIDFQKLTQKIWQEFDYAEPGCESSSECQKRAMDLMARLGHNNPNRTVLAVTHGQVVGVILKALDNKFDYERWTQIRMPDMFRLIYEDNQVTWDKDFKF